jgi:signal peptidase II
MKISFAGYCVMFTGIILDQATKLASSVYLSYYDEVVIIPKTLSLTLVHNYGAAYGILDRHRILLIILSVLVISGSMVFHNKIATSKWSKAGLIFLWSGAIGNFIDRITRGFVIDFLNINIIPVFNVADILINIAVGCFLAELLFTKTHHGH